MTPRANPGSFIFASKTKNVILELEVKAMLDKESLCSFFSPGKSKRKDPFVRNLIKEGLKVLKLAKLNGISFGLALLFIELSEPVEYYLYE